MRAPAEAPPADGLRMDGPAQSLVEFAPAKINLTLAVKGRRADGFHELESLVAFASIGDELSLVPGPDLSLTVTGEFAEEAGRTEANLVLRAAKALAGRLGEVRLGAFLLEKRLPVAAGLGGGSADAAAALRLIARLNGIAPDCDAIVAAARGTGSDVPVCLAQGCRVMRGRGEILGPRLDMPHLDAVLVNPRERLETGRVFAALAALRLSPPAGASRGGAAALVAPREATLGAWLSAIAAVGNDLEAAAIGLMPAIETARLALKAAPGCGLARLTGSGATVFGLFEEAQAAERAAQALALAHPSWWVRQVTLG
jgi:4-diphosphocytidyl-2-C-methyl-D-erythritol kinase